MELLKDAVNELQGREKKSKLDLEVSTPFSSYIPSNYIKNDSERLKQYKKLSNCNSLENLENNKTILEDIYGTFPQEVHNFFMTLECRILLQNLAMNFFGIAVIFLILEKVYRLIRGKGFSITNIDTVLIAEEPFISPHIEAIKASLARVLHLRSDEVGIKATTMEGCGSIGRREGLAAQAIALLIQEE